MIGIPAYYGLDLIVHDKRGNLVLLGEATGVRMPAEDAAEFRKNILAHGNLPDVPFFMIVTPENVFFWRTKDAPMGGELPTFTMDGKQEIQPYLDRIQGDATDDRQAFDLLVFNWLSNLAWFGHKRTDVEWLRESGLMNALDNARVELNSSQ